MKLNWLLYLTSYFLVTHCKEEVSSKSNVSSVVDTVKYPQPNIGKRDIEDSLHYLMVLYLQSKQIQQLQLIDKIAFKSDGELSEAVQLAVVELFEKDAKNLVLYLTHNKNTKLRERLIYGWSEDLSVYTGQARVQELEQFKKKALKTAHTAQLSKGEMRFLQKMLDEVKPNLYD